MLSISLSCGSGWFTKIDGFTALEAFISASTSGGGVISCVTTGPWLAIAPALWQARRQAHVLGVILATATMAYALMEVLANPGAHAWAAGALFAALAVFTAAAAWLRFSRPARP